jgi:hypothetical protein
MTISAIIVMIVVHFAAPHAVTQAITMTVVRTQWSFTVCRIARCLRIFLMSTTTAVSIARIYMIAWCATCMHIETVYWMMQAMTTARTWKS